LSVLFRFTASDYPFSVFKRFLLQYPLPIRSDCWSYLVQVIKGSWSHLNAILVRCFRM